MLYPSIDELKKRADSRYTLVMVASKRSRDLIDGYPSLVDIGNEKPVSIATEEIARDMISYTRKLRSENEEEMTEELGSESAAIAEVDSGEEIFETATEDSVKVEEDHNSAETGLNSAEELIAETTSEEVGDSATEQVAENVDENTDDEK